MATALLLAVCVNSLGLDAIETPFFAVPKLLQDRTGEVGFSLAALKGKLAALLRVLTTDQIFGSSQHFWNLYQVSVPFTIAGGIHTLIETGRSIRHRRQSLHPYLLFWCVGSAVTMLLAGTYTYHVNGIFVALVVFTVDGIVLSLQKLPFRRVLCPMILCAYAVSALRFCGEYFVAAAGIPIKSMAEWTLRLCKYLMNCRIERSTSPMRSVRFTFCPTRYPPKRC